MSESVVKLGFQMELLGLNDVVSQIRRLERDGSLSFSVDKNFAKDLAKASQQVKGSFLKLQTDAVKAAYSPSQLRRIEDGYKRIQNGLEQSALKQLKLQEEIQTSGLNARLKAEKEHELETEKDRMRSLEARFKKEFEKEFRIIERRKKALEEIDRSSIRRWATGMEGAAEGLNSILDNAKGGNLGGFGGMLKEFGKRREEQAQRLQDAGAAKGGGMGAVLGGLGKALKAIAPMLVAIGALVGTIALVGKVLLDADSQFKEFNASLLEGHTSVGDLKIGTDGLRGSLDELHGAFTDLSNNMKWGTVAKDHYQVINAFAQSGYTLKEMTGHLKTAEERMEALKKTTAAALTYSKLLGTSAEETATHMADYMEDLGMTLEGVQSRFSSIFDAAKESGFATKRFFNMILQATSGMSMYNVRLEEAAGLLTRLGKILGTKVGGDFLQGLTKGFSDESMQDRYKRVLTTGPKQMLEIINRSADSVASDFLSKLKDSGMDLGALMGVKIDVNDSGGLVKKLASLDPEAQAELLAKARLQGDADLVRQLENLIGLAKGTQGGVGAQAMALGGLDMGGKLAASLAQVAAIIKKPIHEMSLTDRMAFESITGKSGEEADKLVRLSMGFEGNFRLLQKIASSGVKLTEEERAKQAEEFGFFVNEKGRIEAGRTDEGSLVRSGKEIETLGDYIQGQGSALAEAMKPAVQEDIRIAQEIAANTSELSKVLQQGTEAFLREILHYVRDIASWFGGQSKEEIEAKNKLLSKVDDKIKQVQDVIIGKRGEIATLEKSKAGKSEPERARIDKEISAKSAAIEEGLRTQETLRKAQQHISADKEGKWFFERWISGAKGENEFGEVLASALGASVQDSALSAEEKMSLARKSLNGPAATAAPGESPEDFALRRASYEKKNKGSILMERMGMGQNQDPAEAMKKAEKEALAEDRTKMLEAEKRLHKTDYPKWFADAMGQEMERLQDKEDLARAKDLLIASGVQGSPREIESLAQQMVRASKHGGSPDALKEALRANPGRARELLDANLDMGGFRSVMEHAARGPAENDFLMRLDGRSGAVQSIVKHSPQDQYLIGAKRGGALSQSAGAGKGGGTVVVENHFYNDAKGNYAQIRKVLSTLLGSQGMVGGG